MSAGAPPIDPQLAALIQATHEYNRWLLSGDRSQALDVLRSAVEARLDHLDRHQNESATQLDVVQTLNVAGLLLELESDAESVAFYDCAVELAARPISRLAVFARASAALAFLQLGRLQTAEQLIHDIDAGLLGRLLRTKTLAELLRFERDAPWVAEAQGHSTSVSLAYFAAARFLVAHGRYGSARLAIDCARHHLSRKSDEAGQYELEVKLIFESAAIALQMGEFAQANEALARYQGEMFATSPVLEMRWLILQARSALLNGDLGTCKRMLLAARLPAEKTGQPSALARTVHEFARLLITINQIDRATTLLHTTLAAMPTAIARQFKPQFERTLQLGRSRMQAATSGTKPAVMTFDSEAGLSIDAELQPIYWLTEGNTEATDFEATFLQESLAFRAALVNSDVKTAEPILDTLLTRFGSTDSNLIKSRLVVLLALLALKKRDVTSAARLLESSSEAFAKGSLVFENWQTLALLSLVQSLQGLRMAASASINEADALLQRLTMSLEPEDREAFLLDKATIEEHYLRAQTDLLIDMTNRMKKAPIWRRLKIWHETAAHLIRIIRAANLYRGSRVDQSLELTSAAATRREPSVLNYIVAHPIRRATITFFVLSDRTLIVCHAFLALRWHVAPIGSNEIRSTVNRWQHDCAEWWRVFDRHRRAPKVFKTAPDTSESMRSLDALAARLFEALNLKALLERLPRWVKQLTVFPDDSLHGFPLAVGSINGEHVLRRWDLTLAFPGLPAVAAPSGPRKGLIVAVEEALSLAQRGADSRKIKFGVLTNVAKEATSVKEAMQSWVGPEVAILSDFAPASDLPSRENVASMLRNCYCAHFACHGWFERNAAAESGFILPSHDGEAEVFTIRDVAKNGLVPAYVSLSACYSADSYVLPGRWIIGLPEAFCRSGAKGVVASIWPLADLAGPLLMSEYYKQLPGKTPAEAVRAVQIMCLDGRLHVADLPLSHPFFWAGLCAYSRSSYPERLRQRV